MDLQIRADWTSHSQYHIDFARGSIIHSRAASRGQTNRYFNETQLGGSLKHLTYPQAATFFKKNKTAEMYLQYLRALALNEIERISFQATPSYVRNHQRVFDRAVNTLDYPIAQNTNTGFVRSPLDRQKLVDYMTKLSSQSIRYGQVWAPNKERQKKVIVNSLREIAFAKSE